jgi:hypothetical protein
MKLSATTLISRNPDDVFAYLANRTNLPQWAEEVGSVRKLTKESVGEGSRFRIEGKLAGRVLPSVYEITCYEAPLRLGGHNSGLLAFDESYELEPSAEGTLVRQSADVRLEGHFLFLAPLLRLVLSSQLRRDFKNLKRVLEGMPAAGPAGSEAAAD